MVQQAGVQALGMIECQVFPAVLEAANTMLKHYPISLLGYEKTANSTTVLIVGELEQVKKAIEKGVTSAQDVGEVISLHVIPSPHHLLLTAPGLTVRYG
jgi:microcompartment protein CcmL/EutN